MRVRRTVVTAALALAVPLAWAQSPPQGSTSPAPPGDGNGTGTSSASPQPAPGGDSTGGSTGGDATSAGDATGSAGDGAGTGDAAGGASGSASTPPPIPQAAPLTPEAEAQIGVDPGTIGDWSDARATVHRTLIPPFFLHERGPNHTTTAVFPFVYYERRGTETSILAGPYYRFRQPDMQGDVAFPVYWHWRGHRDDNGGEDWSTLVIPPFYRHAWSGPGEDRGQAFGVAPLFAYGESFARDGRLLREHLVIPPLLTFHIWTPERALSIAGPFYYSRDRTTVDWGFAPLWFAGSDLTSNYLTVPLLLTYHTENHDDGSALTVVGPFWSRTHPQGLSINLAPLFFYSRDATSSSTTILPLLHLSSGPDYRTVASPLWVYARSGNATTFVTWLYQNHRGDTNWDAVAPFFFSSRDPRLGAHTEAVFPFYYHRQSPAGSMWWALPTLHHESDGHDWFTNAYPFVYPGRSGDATHTVVAPFVWDFDNPDTDSHATVVAPFFWRFRHHHDVTQLAGNVLWISGETADGPSYEWHILPLFSYARPRPTDVSWSVLFGLAGYRRYGTHAQMRLFWVPINLD